MLRCSASPRRREAAKYGVAALFLCLTFVLPIVSARDATAAPPRYRVGVCISARELPPPLKNETEAHYYTRMITEFKNVANAIKHKVPRGVVMDVVPILLAKAPDIPGPRACDRAKEEQSKYDIWLHLTSEENARFVYDLRQWEGGDLKRLETNPVPLPNAAQTEVLLAEAGKRIVEKSWRLTATPIQVTGTASRGIIFLYDSSGSMRNTDKGAQNRLGVGQTIGEIVAQTAQIPFAVVVFADSADVLESKPGSNWFETTPADLDVAQARLASALKNNDSGNTNIEAAFKKVALLISSRKDIQRWHVVFFTDGEPTAGTTKYDQIKELVRVALGGKSTLSVIALHGNAPLPTQEAQLDDLVHATSDGSGHPGEILKLKVGDDLKSFRKQIEGIAFLINQATVRDDSMLVCTHGVKKVECELDPSQPHALRFGAAQEVTFVVDTTALPRGTCTATIENQGLGAEPRTVVLPAGQPDSTLSDAGFKIVLSRTPSNDRVFLVVEKLVEGRLNGDWQIRLTVEAP